MLKNIVFNLSCLVSAHSLFHHGVMEKVYEEGYDKCGVAEGINKKILIKKNKKKISLTKNMD